MAACQPKALSSISNLKKENERKYSEKFKTVTVYCTFYLIGSVLHVGALAFNLINGEIVHWNNVKCTTL